MVSRIVPATYADLVFIARRMRDLDAEEIFPLTWTGRPEDLAAGISAVGGHAAVALSGDVPVAAWGATMQRPDFWSVWMFSTDRWPEVALTVTRSIKKDLIPSLVADGAVRADCWSMEGHDVAHRWLESLGAIREASVEDYGSTRKVFHCYSWTRSRLERDGSFDHVRRTVSPENACCAATPAPSSGTSDDGRPSSECGSDGEAQAYFGGEGSEFDHLVRQFG